MTKRKQGGTRRSVQAELFDAMTFGRTHKRRDFAKRAPRQGAGLLLVAKDTGRMLLGLRAAWLSDGCTWSTPGGFAHYREPLSACAIREFSEEMGFSIVGMNNTLKWTHETKDNRVEYTTFIVEIDTEVEAQADGYETLAAQWFTLEEAMEEDLHPKLRQTFNELGKFTHVGWQGFAS